ncbi:MAG: hypothetical protein LBH32_02750 [Dysgonamonadaceae bacterium]|jgi:hypothetical protein|nr:hypothetical protein [Dysgonamonadaceae bacterium]
MFDFDFNIDDGYIDDNGVSELANHSGTTIHFDALENSPFSEFSSHANYDEMVYNFSLVEHSSMIDAGSLHSHDYEPSFGSGHLEPYDHSSTTNLLHRIQDPVGQYAIHNIGWSPHLGPFTEVHLPEDYTVSDIKQACNSIGDVLHWKHLPVNVTDSVDNAAFNSGYFTRFTFDDKLYLNPDYARQAVQEVGSTDVILSNMGHEYGHSMLYKLCGDDISRYYHEKGADFVSGFVNGKLHLDIDAVRKDFERNIFPEEASDFYPGATERWAAVQAGYYFSHMANADNLIDALKDRSFIQIIENISA